MNGYIVNVFLTFKITKVTSFTILFESILSTEQVSSIECHRKSSELSVYTVYIIAIECLERRRFSVIWLVDTSLSRPSATYTGSLCKENIRSLCNRKLDFLLAKSKSRTGGNFRLEPPNAISRIAFPNSN